MFEDFKEDVDSTATPTANFSQHSEFINLSPSDSDVNFSNTSNMSANSSNISASTSNNNNVHGVGRNHVDFGYKYNSTKYFDVDSADESND